MLSENIKSLRKAHGISQEELAVRLNVVRQTVSKWEKGISVPDADVVSKIADIFEVSVSDLLGTRIETEPEQNALAEQLARINEQFAIKNQRSKRIWKIVKGLLITFAVLVVLILVFSAAA